MREKNEVTNYLRKHKRKNPFLQISRDIINDSRLSWKAKGLLTYLLDQSDSWQFYESEICSHGTDGRTSVATGLQELEKYGYLTRDWIRDDHGRYIGRVWEVYEEPAESHEIGDSTDCRKPDIGKSEIGKPAAGKPAANNNNSNDSSKEYKTDLNLVNTNKRDEKSSLQEQSAVVDKKMIEETFIKYLSKSIPDNIYPVLLEYCQESSQVQLIASTLQRKQAEGRIINPLGILINNPNGVIESILNGTFYPEPLDTPKGQVESLEAEIEHFMIYTGIDMKSLIRRGTYQKWRKDWGFTREMILKAAELMALYAQKSSLEYIDRVLNDWRDKGLNTVEDVEKAIKEFKNKSEKSEPTKERSYSEYDLFIPPD
ncbi:DnaD domain protein [Syntrophomonas curvata]